MVSEPGQSRPALLSQRQVDALARQADDPEAIRTIRTAREPGAAGVRPAVEEGAGPIELSADDMQSIADRGEAPEEVAGRIASAERPSVERAAEPPSAEPLSAPSAEPPSVSS